MKQTITRNDFLVLTLVPQMLDLPSFVTPLIFYYFYVLLKDKDLPQALITAPSSKSSPAVTASNSNPGIQVQDANSSINYEIFYAACVLVACKESGNERKVRDILNCFYYFYHSEAANLLNADSIAQFKKSIDLIPSPSAELEINTVFWRLKDSLLNAELLLLRCLGFKTGIHDVFADFARVVNELGIKDRFVLQAGIMLVNEFIYLDSILELLDPMTNTLQSQRSISVAILCISDFLASMSKTPLSKKEISVSLFYEKYRPKRVERQIVDQLTGEIYMELQARIASEPIEMRALFADSD